MRYAFLALIFLLSLTARAETPVQETVHKHIRIAKASIQETTHWRAALNVTIANTGDRADRLVRIATNLAKRVVISDQEGREGAGLTIPGSAEFVIGGGAPRIELIGLKRRLHARERVGLLLVFAQAGKVNVDVVVQTSPARTASTH